MQYTFTIIDYNPTNIQETLSSLERFEDCFCVNTATTKDDGLNAILEFQPKIVFLALDVNNEKSIVLLDVIHELYRYLNKLPYFIITANTRDYAYEAIKAGVTDYILQPLAHTELLRSLLKIKKNAEPPPEPALQAIKSVLPDNGNMMPKSIDSAQICIKSYGDYQFIALNEIVYLKADNNTTDFHLESGRKLTAYKTLKFYENNLPPHFFRIHNSYIVNSSFVTRINTGKSLCYLNGNEISVAFSKTFKDNVEAIIRGISPEYL